MINLNEIAFIDTEGFDYEEEWDEMLYPQGNMFYAYAYVWNKSDDFCSEFGTIGIRSFGGGIKRVA